MLQDTHEATKIITPPLATAGPRHGTRNSNINAYNSLSKPEAKDGENDSYTVTLTTSPAGRRPSVFEDSVVGEAKSQPSRARRQ